METDPQPRVTYADRLEDGVIITFDNGKCVIYPASLFYAFLPQATEVVKLEAEEIGYPKSHRPPHWRRQVP